MTFAASAANCRRFSDWSDAQRAGTQSAERMSKDFIETGQTFTEDNAAYCPVERKERGAAGVAASLAVLAGGAAFLTYAMLGAPAPNPPQTAPVASDVVTAAAAPADVSAPDPASIDAPTIETVAPKPPADNATSTDVLIAEALAESRAARAANYEEEFAFKAPSIKPTFDKRIVAALPSARITPIGAVAKAHAAPKSEPTFLFLPADREMRSLVPAVAYTRDVSRDAVDVTVTIARGETFVDALKRAGVTAADRHAAAYAFGNHYNLRRLKPGQQFKLRIGWPNQTIFQLSDKGEPEARLIALSFRDGFEQEIELNRASDGVFDAEATPVDLTTHLHAVEGRIDGSLYLSAKALGTPDEIIAGLADAFAYDVDFQREIFGGDEFELIFEAKYDDRGEMAGGGEILYARLNWRGKSRQKGYYRFEEHSGRADFYDAAGQSAKRLLMKTPIDGARLSSRFGTRRHPILGYRRAHKGVDFAAPRGTPIKAAGDGVVERADRYGSFGNYIRIRHANGYKTAYAHLNGFRKGIRKGRRVRQGDIIGYVGTTGRSTGPHLHYEVHHKGKAVNPQKLKIATGKKLTGSALERFKLERDRIDLLRTPEEGPAPLFAEGETPEKDRL